MINKYQNLPSKSRGEPLCPLASDSVVFCSVLSVLSGDAAHQWVSRVTVREKGTNGQQHFGDSQSRAPIVLKNVQTNHSLTVDITVINPCSKCYLEKYNHDSYSLIN